MMKVVEKKAPKAGAVRVQLEKADYFEFRTRVRDAEVVELDTLKAMQKFEQRTVETRRLASDCFEALAKKYGFDPKLLYRWDDETFELVADEAEAK